MLTHIARDCETNETIHLFTDNPRRELLNQLGRRTAKPMYVNSRSGDKTFQIGWIIRGRWLEIYSVTPMREEQ